MTYTQNRKRKKTEAFIHGKFTKRRSNTMIPTRLTLDKALYTRYTQHFTRSPARRAATPTVRYKWCGTTVNRIAANKVKPWDAFPAKKKKISFRAIIFVDRSSLPRDLCWVTAHDAMHRQQQQQQPPRPPIISLLDPICTFFPPTNCERDWGSRLRVSTNQRCNNSPWAVICQPQIPLHKHDLDLRYSDYGLLSHLSRA